MGYRALRLRSGPDSPGELECERRAAVRSLCVCGSRIRLEPTAWGLAVRALTRSVGACFLRSCFSDARSGEFAARQFAATRFDQPDSAAAPGEAGTRELLRGGCDEGLPGKTSARCKRV